MTFKWTKKYGNIVRFGGLFNRPRVLITDPKLIQEIAINRTYDFVKPMSMLANLVSILGNGVFFAEGEIHKRQRKMMNPAFSHINIKVIKYFINESII